MSTVAPTSSAATSKKTISDPAYASTHLGSTASGRNESSSVSRARPGLRCDDHSVVGGGGCDGVTGPDHSGCRQHDLSKHDKQSNSSRKKTPVRSWRHKLNVCRYPSIESIDSVGGDVRPTSFRRTSSDHGILAGAFDAAGAATSNNAMVTTTRSGEVVAVYSNDPPSATTATIKRNTRNSPFCPCFSPTDSDLDEEEPVACNPSQRPTVEQHAPSRASSSRRSPFINSARDFRSFFGVTAEASNQISGPTEGRRIGDGMTMSDQPYPVHTTVEYTHYLVPDMLQITNAPYYWGIMDRFEAEKKLDGKPEGTFLLRDSAQSDYLFSVSFRRYQRTLHARIEEMNHRFSFDSYDTAVFSAPTVTQLIENYKDPARCLFFEPQLTHPLHRNFVFPLQHLCRASIASKLNYNDLAKLPAPRKLKDYLREYHYKQPVRVTNNETAAEHSA